MCYGSDATNAGNQKKPNKKKEHLAKEKLFTDDL